MICFHRRLLPNRGAMGFTTRCEKCGKEWTLSTLYLLVGLGFGFIKFVEEHTDSMVNDPSIHNMDDRKHWSIEKYNREAEQHYEMAGMARRDGDIQDMARHTRIAKYLDEERKMLYGG